MMKFILTLLVLFVGRLALAHPFYEDIAITPKTWEEVDLTYTQTIHGTKYPASIKLLRPISWLKDHGMEKVGHTSTLSLLELDADKAVVTVGTIKPAHLDTSRIKWGTRHDRPVVGIFMH